jgi:DAK2 domain fusion protein YloV
VPQVPQTFFDALAVRTWCGLALRALGRAREDIDAINVYPVPDGDTGTNLYLTVESAAAEVDALFAAHDAGRADTPAPADAVRAMAHGALIGARGNSGTILAQLLRGTAQVLAAPDDGPRADGDGLRRALRHAADSARRAVAHPVEGTMLSVATAAADAASGTDGDGALVARAAYDGALAALAATPGQLAALERAGVVDAGGHGLVLVLAALVETLTGQPPAQLPPPVSRAPEAPAQETADGCAAGPVTDGPAYEVLYLLEAGEEAVTRLRERLDELGDCLVVVGGDGLWNVHVHVDDAGAAVEAGVEAGRPYRIRVTHFASADAHPDGHGRGPSREMVQRAVVAVVTGAGLAELYSGGGATTVLAPPGEQPGGQELLDAVRRAHAREVVLLPNDAELRRRAAVTAEQARAEGIRVALIPTRSAVQGIAALAVHQPERRFDEDVVAMTSAAGATRYAEVAVAERQSWTTAGICQAGDVLGLLDGDVAVIGADLADVASTVLDRMLAAGGELVTLVVADEAPESLAEHLETHVRESHLAVDTVVYRGGRQGPPLLIGVE